MSIRILPIFTVHSPYVLEKVSFFDLGAKKHVQNCHQSKKVFSRYLKEVLNPFVVFIDELFKHTGGRFRYSMLPSGVFLEQLQQYKPADELDFVKFYYTTKPELIVSTYYNSVCYFHTKKEFEFQIKKHRQLLENTFGQRSSSALTTKLFSNLDLSRTLCAAGFKNVLTSTRHVPCQFKNHIFKIKGLRDFRVFPVETLLSELFVSTLQDRQKETLSQKLEAFSQYLGKTQASTFSLIIPIDQIAESLVNERTRSEISSFIIKIIENGNASFETPTSYVRRFRSERTGCLLEENLNTYKGSKKNELQREALKKLYKLERSIKQINCPIQLENWRILQDVNHIELMNYSNNLNGNRLQELGYLSVYDAYTNYMNCVADIDIQLINVEPNP